MKGLPTNYDRRAAKLSSVAVREADGGGSIVSGLVVPFRARSEDLGGFTEEFRDITPAENVFALWSHSRREVLGSTEGGNLTLEKTSRGLEIELVDPAMSAVDLDRITRFLPNASFGFRSPTDEVVREEGRIHRIVRDAVLVEVSLGVAFPAYTQTDISAAKRSIEEAANDSDELGLVWRTQQAVLRGEIASRML